MSHNAYRFNIEVPPSILGATLQEWRGATFAEHSAIQKIKGKPQPPRMD